MPHTTRIVILIDRYLPIMGGAQHNVHLLCRHLLTLGCDVQVLTRRVSPELPKQETIDGIKIRRFAGTRFRLLSKIWCILAFVFELIRNRDDYDVVLAVPSVPITAEFPAYLATLFTRKPFLVRTTSLDFELLLTRDRRPATMDEYVPAFIWRRIYRRASLVIAQSDFIENRARALGIVNTDTVVNPVDLERFRPATDEERKSIRQRLNIPSNRVVAVYSSRYVHRKNHLTLIKAAEFLEREGARGDLYIILLGATEKDQVSSNEKELKEYVLAHDLTQIVEFRDDVPNVEDYLRSADLFVFPTTYGEGMSNAQLEAMACGLPVIASNLPQVLAALPDNWTFTFDPTEPDALVSMLRHLIDEPDKRRELGAQLAEFVRARHEPQKIAERYFTLINDAIQA